MKDKVKQLAEQAGFVFWNNEEWKPEDQVIDWSSVYDKELEKFAELIVKECILTIQKGISLDGNTTEKFLRTMKHLKDIKEHFGVE